jgi:hypothetical protein
VRVRALALDESMKAVDGWQVAMDIIVSILHLSRSLFLYSDTVEVVFSVSTYLIQAQT